MTKFGSAIVLAFEKKRRNTAKGGSKMVENSTKSTEKKNNQKEVENGNMAKHGKGWQNTTQKNAWNDASRYFLRRF